VPIILGVRDTRAGLLRFAGQRDHSGDTSAASAQCGGRIARLQPR